MTKIIIWLIGLLAVAMATASEAQTVTDDQSVDIAGQRMRCSNAPVEVDASLPMEGMFVPGEGIYINPELMQYHPVIVRKFIFAHECAHKTVGGDELGADCAAAQRGARDGWLTEEGIDAICRDLQAVVADETHPPGTVRCANIKRCFAGSAPSKAIVATRASSVVMRAPSPKPQAFSASSPPLAEKLRRAAGAWRSAFNPVGLNGAAGGD